MTSDILTRLVATLEARKNAPSETSYVASLYAGAPSLILKKIGEEATELVVATTTGKKSAIIHETADLWFHSLVLLVQQGVKLDEVFAELERRFGVSGLEEKSNR